MIGAQVHHRDLAVPKGNRVDWHSDRVEARARVRVDRLVKKILVVVAALVG
jgi:hypothetical protein